MSKKWKPGRTIVELHAARPSRIRRDPPAAAPANKPVRAYPSEREIWAVVIGVILFALAITALAFGISDITSG